MSRAAQAGRMDRNKIMNANDQAAALGHMVPRFTMSLRRGVITCTGQCRQCGGSVVVQHDLHSTEADALSIFGSALTMECAS